MSTSTESRGAFSDVDTFYQAVKRTQQNIEDVPFCHNYIGTQQSLGHLRDIDGHIIEFKEKLDELKKDKNEDVKESLSFEHLVLEDYALQKQRCLEESLYVSDIENMLQTFETEMSSRACYLIKRPKVFESVYRGEDIEVASRLHKDSVYAVRNAWSWAMQVECCLQIHIKNAAVYHQYFYDVQHLLEDMNGFLSWLNCVKMKRKLEIGDPDVMGSHIRNVLNHLLDYQLRTEKLFEQSRQVYPVNARTEPLKHAVKAKVLLCYQHEDILIVKGETCILLENSDPAKWKIRNCRGKEGEVPAILLVIPPPHSEACNEASRLRQQMVVLWRAAQPLLRQHIMTFLSKIAKDTQTKQLQTFSASQKANTMKLLNEAIQIFHGSSFDQDYKNFQKHIAGIRRVLTQTRTNKDQADSSSEASRTWYKAERVVMMYKNLKLYSSNYEETVKSSTEQQQVMLQLTNPPLTYTSKAYFEKAKPIEINQDTSKSSNFTVKAEIYISERFSSSKQTNDRIDKLKSGNGSLTKAYDDDVDGCQLTATKNKENHQMKPFAITGVLDHQNRPISLLKAFTEGILDQVRGTYTNPKTGAVISIPEAISRGLIVVNYKDELGDSKEKAQSNGIGTPANHIDSSSILASGIVDPRTGEVMSIKQAIASGILNMTSGKYINPITKEEMPLLEAVKTGYVQINPSVIEALSEPGVYTQFQLGDVTYVVDNIVDPSTKANISLKRAISDNIIDLNTGTYRNPVDGESIPVSEAVSKGLIAIHPLNPNIDKNNNNTICVKELRVKQERYIAAHTEAVLLNCDNVDSSRPDPNVAIYEKLSKKVDLNLKGIKDPNTSKSLTIDEAYQKGVLNFAKISYDQMDGELIPLPEATAKGVVESNVLKEILSAYEESSVGVLIDKGVFDSETGLVTDVSNGQTVSIHTAVQQEIIHPEMTYFYEVPSNQILSLSGAIENGRYDIITGKYVKAHTHEEMDLKKAAEKGLIRTHIDPEEISKVCESLNHLRHYMNTDIKGVVMPNSNEVVSIDEAVRAGVLDLTKCLYVNETLGEKMPLIKAVKSEKIEVPVALQLFSALNKMSLFQQLMDNKIHPVTGLVSLPNSATTLTIKQATEAGYLQPDHLYFIDQTSGEIATVASYTDEGKFNPENGTFLNNQTGKFCTISQAIEEGLIDASVAPEKYIENAPTLRELIDKRKINPRNSVFVAPEGQEIPLRNAMADGFLTMNSKVRIDQKNGCVTLASNEEVVKALVRVKEKAAWLSEVEKLLVSQTKPSENLEHLKKQQIETKTIHQDLEREQPVVKSTLAEAEEILEAREISKKAEKDQQYQKLRYNTSDLKFRFGAASNEAETRTKKFDDLYEDLEDFYNIVEDLDQWMDTAVEKGHGIKVSQQDLEVQYGMLKKYVEELKAKEGDISALVKLADKFRDDTQEFMNGVDRYRKCVHILPTIKEETEESAMIDDEIEALEGKYRSIVQESERYLAKLAFALKHDKSFQELSNKLNSNYSDIKAKFDGITDGSDATRDSSEAYQLEKVKQLKVNVLNQEKRIRDLQHVGTKLVDELNELNMTPKANSVKDVMEDKKAVHKDLYHAIENKEGVLNSVLSESKNVIKQLDNLGVQLSSIEDELMRNSEICLEKQGLEEQIHEQRRIQADLSTNKTLLENLLKESSDVNGAREKILDLNERIANVETLSERRISDLEEVMGNIEDLEDKIGVMKSWLTSSIGMIQQNGEGPSQNLHMFKSKIDALYAEKKSKEPDINDIKDLVKHIAGKENVSNGCHLKEAAADVQEEWHQLTELLVQKVSVEALTEIESMLKYMDKAENEINTAESVSSDPDTLTVQLRDHQVFHDDLNMKRNCVKDIINKCNLMLRETTNTQTEAIKSRLDSIQTQADIVCQLSLDRLQHLESALPLASHFSENQAEISAWLEEMEAELKTQNTSGENLDQVKKQLDNLKVTQKIIEDHKPFVEDLKDTGMELMEFCGDDDSDDLQNKLLSIITKYDNLKLQARQKAQKLMEQRKAMTQEVSDTLENLLEDLAEMDQTINNVDPIPATPDKLYEEIEDNKMIMERLQKHQSNVENAQQSVVRLINQGVEDQAEIEEMNAKVGEIVRLAQSVSSAALERDRQLNQVVQVSSKFYDKCNEVKTTIKDLRDNLYSQEPPGIDPPTIKEQQKELLDIRQTQENTVIQTAECRKVGSKLSSMCGDPGKIEVQKQLEDIDNVAEDLNDVAYEREEELNAALGYAQKFQVTIDAIRSWLPVSQKKLSVMKVPSTDKAALRSQIEELKLFKMQTHPHVADVDILNQHMTALNDLSPVAAEYLVKPVSDINEQWNELIKGIADREEEQSNLNETQVKVGEIDHAIENVLGSLTGIKTDIDTLDEVIGDPKCIETQLKKLQLIQDDVKNQSLTTSKLKNAVDNLISRSGDADSPLQHKTNQVSKLLREVEIKTKDQENKLQETLRYVKKFSGDVDDMLHWITDLRMELKSQPPFGALPETARGQLDNFIKRCEELEIKEDCVKSLQINGQDMMDRCQPENIFQLSEKLKKLRERWYETKNRTLRRRDKMKEHLQHVEEFHTTLKKFSDWLNSAETLMRGFKFPSKIVEKVCEQIKEHADFKKDVQSYTEWMQKLDRTGTYLKYFGRKQDTIYIKNLLVGIRLRWKKLLRRTDERERLLQQSYHEDRRFEESWKDLCDWLDSSEDMLTSFLTPQLQAASMTQVGKMKDEMDELKPKPVDMETRISQLLHVKLFQHQLAAKHSLYYSTTRLGRNLKDRCTKSDQDRDILQAMLDQLKNKWNLVRSVVSKSQNKLDEALLTSGRVSDALNSLQEWLSKAEAMLSKDECILGDYDTVNLLIEQHKSVQQELEAREQTLEALKSAGSIPEQHIEDLVFLWKRINLLSESREARLKEALTLADEFQDVVQVMREFLPTVESELKFRPLPDDELSIIHLIERHEKFQERLRNHQDTVDKIKVLAERILKHCHPNAVRFVKYYLTITQTRWDQLIQRSHSRAQRLQDALKSIQGNAALLEELLAWLTDCQVLLATKEKDPIPEDIQVVETLLKEHQDLHEEITSKNADADRLTKIVTSESKLSQGRHYGSNWRLNEIDGHNPRVIALQNKWRTVWRMSVDRKKKLQDALETLMELESFKNFDFDLWRQRYLSWIQEKKLRITDFFRRQDKDCDGALTRKEFVEGMIQTKFPTNKTELNAVFDIFDPNHTGKIVYRNFIAALKPDRHKQARLKTGKRQATDSEMIHDEVERQISQCQCRHQFKAERIQDGQYRFGENLKLKLVRFLNSCVMVRVGGGWVTLDEFLETNDPCRAKNRTNTELREQFVLADGVSQTRAAFRSKTPDPTMYKKRGSDAGSNGNLSRSKRLSTSSHNLSTTKSSRTPKSPGLQTGNSRPKTPTMNSSNSKLSTPGTTPVRPSSTTPARPNSTTPNTSRSTTPVAQRMGAQRRLPSTPKSSTPKTPLRPRTPTAHR
ncbi:microtubule-actin cross-linking factor 1 isoform X4 [Octopus sinensis]|uniref:Microtubule-actin cross-linking factor 1 isoform X4 n=1 Tax=Octopus sinensis TaxID=2607531 RepID=A0A7E6FKG7_9MOLL|nr:microtubule-actin cross-linking factor 1 isoform X4 [Octopus sinensis]